MDWRSGNQLLMMDGLEIQIPGETSTGIFLTKIGGNFGLRFLLVALG
jgi:hypothetical protein